MKLVQLLLSVAVLLSGMATAIACSPGHTFKTKAEAEQYYGKDAQIVWLNFRSSKYHAEGTCYYNWTVEGAFVSRADADAASCQAARIQFCRPRSTS